jgi:hypothetical protein
VLLIDRRSSLCASEQARVPGGIDAGYRDGDDALANLGYRVAGRRRLRATARRGRPRWTPMASSTRILAATSLYISPRLLVDLDGRLVARLNVPCRWREG